MSNDNEFDLILENEQMKVDGQQMSVSSCFDYVDDDVDIMDLNFHIDHQDPLMVEDDYFQSSDSSMLWEDGQRFSIRMEPY